MKKLFFWAKFLFFVSMAVFAVGLVMLFLHSARLIDKLPLIVVVTCGFIILCASTALSFVGKIKEIKAGKNDGKEIDS